MTSRKNWARRRREDAWAFGRGLCADLIEQYRKEYELIEPPPPARIIDEILRDILNVGLRASALPLDRFAEAKYVDGRVVVVVNSRTRDIEAVKDDQGVQNVAKWHECIHVVADLEYLREERPPVLPGFETDPVIVCWRGLARFTTPAEAEREFWAEEAGRAAAVSLPALSRSDAFRALLRGPGRNRDAWPLLYQAASDIAVNISALVKQLHLEGLIVLVKEGGRNQVYVQPALLERMESE
jgi:hypothetical protein